MLSTSSATNETTAIINTSSKNNKKNKNENSKPFQTKNQFKSPRKKKSITTSISVKRTVEESRLTESLSKKLDNSVIEESFHSKQPLSSISRNNKNHTTVTKSNIQLPSTNSVGNAANTESACSFSSTVKTSNDHLIGSTQTNNSYQIMHHHSKRNYHRYNRKKLRKTTTKEMGMKNEPRGEVNEASSHDGQLKEEEEKISVNDLESVHNKFNTKKKKQQQKILKSSPTFSVPNANQDIDIQVQDQTAAAIVSVMQVSRQAKSYKRHNLKAGNHHRSQHHRRNTAINESANRSSRSPIQQRDVTNSTNCPQSTINDDTRTANSPINTSTNAKTGLNPSSISLLNEKVGNVTEKTTDNVSKTHTNSSHQKGDNKNKTLNNASGDHNKKYPVSHQKQHKSFRSNRFKSSDKVVNEEVTTIYQATNVSNDEKDAHETKSVVPNNNIMNDQCIVSADDDDDADDVISYPSSSNTTATANVVTTNAAGKDILKRLSVPGCNDSTPPPVEAVSPVGGCTASITTSGTFNDNDVIPELSGDLSGIVLNVNHDGGLGVGYGYYDQATIATAGPFIYPNPITFPPMASLPNHGVPMVATSNDFIQLQQQHQHQQQWISSLSDTLPPQDCCNNMMQCNVQQYQAPPPQQHVGTAQVDYDNVMSQQAPPFPPFVLPNYYGPGYPAITPFPMAQMYHQQQQSLQQPSSNYIPFPTQAPPLNYEQVSIGGCVFFNPVYENQNDGHNVDGDGESSVVKINDSMLEHETTMSKEVNGKLKKSTNHNMNSVDKSNVGGHHQKRKGKNRNKKRNQKKKALVTKTEVN